MHRTQGQVTGPAARRPVTEWAVNLVHTIDRPSRVNLREISTLPPAGIEKETAAERVKELGKELDRLEDLMYAAGRDGLLIVLQGMDTAGKDGMIRCLLKYCNALGGHVWPFKVPTEEELAHDFLWRIHKKTPGRGEFAIFNRSHYEDVLVVRVKNFVPEPVWKARYDQINAFEELIASNNTIVLKFFLHISKDEQKERLLAREEDVEKAYKLNVGDWQERELWDLYQEAYEDAIGKCAASHAPWHIVPADKKWFRDLAVMETVVAALAKHADGWTASLAKEGEVAKAELAAFRAAQTTG